MSKLYAAALVLGAIAGSAFLASVGCTTAQEEDTGTALGAAGESDAGDAGVARGTLVISAVYPMGGRTGALYKNDYVEILNKSAKPVKLDGLSIQLSATGTGPFATAIPLTGEVAAGGYFLVPLGSGGAAGEDVPDPSQPIVDTKIGEDSSSAAQAAGKVALALGTAALGCGQNGVACPTSKLLDLVGWGATSAWEGATSAPKLTDATKALARAGNACGDTDNNGKDFALTDPKPRSAGEPVVNCNPPKPEAGVDANSIPQPVKDPPLGEESPFDAGVRRDAGATGAAAGAGDDSCAVGGVGALGAGSLSPLVGVALALAYAARRRRREA